MLNGILSEREERMTRFLKTISLFLCVGINTMLICSNLPAEIFDKINFVDKENALCLSQKDFSAAFDTSYPPKPFKNNIEIPFYTRIPAQQQNKTFLMSVVTLSLQTPRKRLKIPLRCKEKESRNAFH